MKAFLRLLAGALHSQRQYPVAFHVSLLLYGMLVAGDFTVLALILTRFPDVAGWTLPQVALLVGVSGTTMGLYRTFAGELHEFERYMITGEFDALLLRLWPSLLVVLVHPNRTWSRWSGACTSAEAAYQRVPPSFGMLGHEWTG